MSAIREIALAKAIGGSGGGSSVTVESLTVTENKTYTAPSGKAYSPVNAAVPNSYSAGDEGKVVSDGALVAQTSRTVNANNTYDTTLNNEMVVNVQPPLQEKTVNANGDVTPDTGYYGLSKVIVNVPPSGGGEGEVTPDYAGLSYSYIALNGQFYQSKEQTSYMTLFPIEKGHKYACYLSTALSNRLRIHQYYDKEIADFYNYLTAPYGGSASTEAIYTCDINETGSTELVNNDIQERFIFTAVKNGMLVVLSSNLSDVVPALLYDIGVSSSEKIVDWRYSSDEDIVWAIQAAHAGTINLQRDFSWQVGQKRTITISAYTDGVYTHASKDIELYISSFKDYNNCGCVLQFDFYTEIYEKMRMNATNTNVGGYGSSEMKTVFLPSLVDNGIPSWLKGLLIEFDVLAGKGNQTSESETVTGNKLALRSKIEVQGNDATPGEGKIVDLYINTNKRTKVYTYQGSSQGNYWFRSPNQGNNTQFFCFNGQPAALAANASSTYYVAPFGCI